MFVLAEHNSIANQFLVELRDKVIQKDRARFRKNMERMGMLLAYEISKTLSYKNQTVTTPLGDIVTPVPANSPVIATILRAGLPLFQGVLSCFEQADTAFIGAYRKHTNLHHTDFSIQLDYISTPSLENKVLIITDPMLATGKSIAQTIDELAKFGKPACTHLVAVVASKHGVEFLKNKYPSLTIWTAAIDEHLNDQFYIIPGLGDAGDLSFGEKL